MNGMFEDCYIFFGLDQNTRKVTTDSSAKIALRGTHKHFTLHIVDDNMKSAVCPVSENRVQ